MKINVILLSLFIGALSVHAQVLTLTGFGTTEFSVDTGSTLGITVNQTATNIGLVGNDQTSSFAGTFATFDMTGYMGGLDLTASVSGTNPGSSFDVVLFDSSFNQFLFSGNWSSFGTSPTQVTLSPVPSMNPFLPDQVIGMSLQFAGSGNSFNITLDALTVGAAAIPEPSTYALLAMGFGLVGLAIRRRAQRF